MADSYKLGGLYHNSFDICADGTYLYIAALDDSNNPVILRQDTGLESNAVLSHNPGTGSRINLMAGDYDAYFIWASGDFGGDVKVIATEDGDYWYTRNWSPYTYWVGNAEPILVGPGDDNLITVMTNSNFAIHQTYFVGDTLYWLQDPTLPFKVGAFDRGQINPVEMLIGIGDEVYWYTNTDIVNYSPDEGLTWGDNSTGLDGNKVTTIIFG
jgi:hypothetical protein